MMKGRSSAPNTFVTKREGKAKVQGDLIMSPEREGKKLQLVIHVTLERPLTEDPSSSPNET